MSVRDVNFRLFSSPTLLHSEGKDPYGEVLFPAEQAILDLLPIRVEDFLDLGVGTGRTTPYFSPRAVRYIGVDYSSAMVATCKERFPDLEFDIGDATSLREFGEDTFDVVWFSFNGIDNVDSKERAAVLAEARRVLRTGGKFIFSTHNLGAPPSPPTWLPAPHGSKRPTIRQRLSTVKYHLIDHWNYRRLRGREVRGEGYAILVDPAHNYQLVQFYAGHAFQRRELVNAGFEGIQAFGMDGRNLAPDAETSDAWLYFLATARK